MNMYIYEKYNNKKFGGKRFKSYRTTVRNMTGYNVDVALVSLVTS